MKLKGLILQDQSKTKQYLVVLAVVGVAVAGGLIVRESVGYRVIAFALLLCVSLLSLFLDILPVILSAFLSALLWDFLFIPPQFTFAIKNTEDQLLFATYFIVALVHGVLSAKIRYAQKEISQREEKANSVKYYNTLLNSLSHELRTPITTIIGACDNLSAANEKLSQQNKQVLIEQISNAALRLNHQVENLLNMSRLESGVFKIKKDWVDVSELVYNVINRLGDSLKGFPITVSVPDNFPLFKLDYGLMEQILANLLGNVIQHTPSGTSIEIKATCVNEKLVLVVADRGHGFPKDEVEKVFEKFYRLKGAKTGGTGLGLSIVKGFVEAQGGRITLCNLSSGGAEFTMTFEVEVSYLTRLKNE
ncbi:MAG: DUF4118 domain-containing protein [Bacteroidetes bacterium]|nr:DUF4118 domain-containing protein [Bacteroidota bacterium]MBS1540827.1 DUF4118 domain-containing protein [Bacteroidota bacterium]